MKCEDRAKLTLQELLIILGSIGKIQLLMEYASISALCLFLCPFPSVSVQINISEDLIRSSLSLSPHPHPHLVNPKTLYLVPCGKERRREKRESLCFGIYFPVGLGRPFLHQGEHWGVTSSWR